MLRIASSYNQYGGQFRKTKMRIKFLFILIPLFWFGFRPNRSDFNYCKKKSKHIADSIIYNLVDKINFNNYYEFKKDFSFIIEKGSNNEIFFANKFYNKPIEYNVTYVVKKSTIVNAKVIIELDSNFKLQKIYNLTDDQYSNDIYLNQKNIEPLVSNFNFKEINSVKYIYDTIPNKRTFKPFIEIMTFSYAFKGDCEDCSTIIDSCYKIDPATKKIIKRYKRVIKMVSQS